MSNRLALDSMSRVPVRVAAELGRSKLSLHDALSIRPGEVLDLDKNPNEPVDIYVDGVHYATGTLVVVDGNWAVRLERIVVEAKPELLQPPVEETADTEAVDEEASIDGAEEA
jgi:flagellar motor switch protein FliN/FliY